MNDRGSMIKKASGMVAAAALLAVAAGAQDAWARKHRKDEVERTIRRCEERSDWLRKAVDRRLDKSRLDGSRKEDRINHAVSELERSLDRLRGRFDRKDSWWETRVDVENVMRHAQEVNKVIGPKSVFGADIKSGWRNLKAELNRLARTYDISQAW